MGTGKYKFVFLVEFIVSRPVRRISRQLHA
jgi:hypothetical protein